jgi:uncharacterized cupin superfamily protein
MDLHEAVTSGPNFTALHAGDWADMGRYEFPHPLLPRPVKGKLFLKEPLGLTGMELSLNKLPPGKGVPFLHKHRQNEELYLFVKGRGQFQVDGAVIDVREGTCVRVSPGGARTWRNNSTEDLYYVVIQAREGSLSQWTLQDGVPLPDKVEWPAEVAAQ